MQDPGSIKQGNIKIDDIQEPIIGGLNDNILDPFELQDLNAINVNEAIEYGENSPFALKRTSRQTHEHNYHDLSKDKYRLDKSVDKKY